MGFTRKGLLVLQNLFTTPIYNTNLNVDNKLLENLAYKEKEKDKNGRKVSNNGYQTKDLDFNLYKFLFDEVSKSAIDFYKNFGVQIRNHKFVNFWINISGKHNYNRLHAHGNCFLSGAYYIKVPKNSGNIVFENPNLKVEDTFSSFFEGDGQVLIKDYNVYNSTEWHFTPKVGQLLIFPSYLRHYVEANQSDEDRISLSFNIRINQ